MRKKERFAVIGAWVRVQAVVSYGDEEELTRKLAALESNPTEEAWVVSGEGLTEIDGRDALTASFTEFEVVARDVTGVGKEG